MFDRVKSLLSACDMDLNEVGEQYVVSWVSELDGFVMEYFDSLDEVLEWSVKHGC